MQKCRFSSWTVSECSKVIQIAAVNRNWRGVQILGAKSGKSTVLAARTRFSLFLDILKFTEHVVSLERPVRDCRKV